MALLPPVSMIQHYSTYTRVTGSVSIQKIRSVPYWYGKLLTLLVYLMQRRQQRGGGGQLGSLAMAAAPRAVTGILQWRQWHGCGGSSNSGAALVVAITRRRRPNWKRGGSAALSVAAPWWEAQRQRGGGGGTNNQQSTKRATATATEMALMKAMTMTMETKDNSGNLPLSNPLPQPS